MRASVHYMVQGNARLRDLASANDLFLLLSEPFIVMAQEGGCGVATSRADHELRVKVFTLLNFISEYPVESEIGAFLNSAPLSGEFFDTWWELTKAVEAVRMPAFGETFKVANISRACIPSAGCDAVEDWLSRVVSF